MTKKTLIEKLKQYPDDALILLGVQGQQAEITGIKSTDIGNQIVVGLFDVVPPSTECYGDPDFDDNVIDQMLAEVLPMNPSDDPSPFDTARVSVREMKRRRRK